MKYIVELHEGSWLANWDGDPGRTLVFESAKQFKSKSAATIALGKALRYRDFSNAKVLPIEQPKE